LSWEYKKWHNIEKKPKPMMTAGLVALKDRKLLLAYSKNKQAYYLPGGKTNWGETSLEALIREIREELNVRINPDELRFYIHISVQAYGEREGTIMEQDCFIHDLKQLPEPGAEINGVRYFDRFSYSLESDQVPGVVILMQQLKQDNLID
jgi:ADP-ribose pyrophosphatase YjhB (NUDIX family)